MKEVIKITFIKEKTNDDKAKHVGLMVGIPDQLYMWTVSKHSTLYMEYVNEQWCVWRETYDSNKPSCISYKSVAQGDNFNMILSSANKYMKYVRQLRGK